MTSRRERPPSGRNNVTARGEGLPRYAQVRPLFMIHILPYFGGSNAFQPLRLQNTGNARPATQQNSARSNNSRPSTAGPSARSYDSALSTNEILRRMRESNDLEKNARMTAEIHALGDYNSFSRPKSSSVSTFCSVWIGIVSC